MALVRERLIYEIAMTIGNSQVMETMLKESLTTYLRKLNCLAGAVFRQQEREGRYYFDVVYAIPKRMRPNSVFRQALDTLPHDLDGEELDSFMTSLPDSTVIGNHCCYTMKLPRFGVLLLVKSAPGLSEVDLKSLAQINAKLARACVFCDINSQLKTEIEERRKAEEKYRAIVDNAIDGIYQSSLDGRYLHVNPALARIFGYESPQQLMDEVDDVGVSHYVHAEDRERFVDLLMREGQVNLFEFEYERKDGTRGWMSTSARLSHDEKGNPLYVEGACRDISPAKRAELALREAKHQAERLSQLKSNLISMVSHELRTPLTSILGFAIIMRKRLGELLESESFSESTVAVLDRVAENTGVIITEGERLTELINNVLDLAKLEAGQYEWSMQIVSLSEIMQRSIQSISVLFEETPVELISEVPEDLPLILGDRDRLIQVAINLLSNAAKFTEEGEVRVSGDVENGSVVIRVADTGYGVPEGKVDEIFETFRQLDHARTGKPRGTGLGLPICREIVEYHGGHVWHEDAPGGGSIFAFSVPVATP